MLITPEYIEQQQAMHKGNSGYGSTGSMYGDTVSQMIDQMEIDHVLDYGAGHNLSLKDHLKPEREFRYQAYDPGVEELSGLPEPAEMVVSFDVLEHIEPECVEEVMDHLEELTEKILFCSICYIPAMKTLPDGRNAHLIQKDMDWWLPKFWERFQLQGVHRRGSDGFEVIALRKEWGAMSWPS